MDNITSIAFEDPPSINPKWWENAGVLLALSFAAIVLRPIAYYFLYHDAPPKGLKLFPGPQSTLPYIGRVKGLDPNKPWEAIKKWCDEYDGIYRLTMAGEMHLWINDTQLANHFFVKNARKYSSRPEIAAVPGSDTSGQYLPLLAYNDHWRKQRRFAQVNLSRGIQNKFYGYVSHEAKRFLHQLLQSPHDHYELTYEFCGRISARLGYGKPDSAPFHCWNARNFIPHIGPGGSVLNLMPFLRVLPEWMIPSKRASRQRRELEGRTWPALLRGARDEYEKGMLPISYARTYLERQEKETETKDDEARSFGFDDKEASNAVGMLTTVAIFTIGGPLTCFFIAMVLHPEWQSKVREEYDRVVGNRVIEPSDSPNLPILRACLKETIRWRPPVPLGVPRLVQEDDEWNGYYIPKGAVVHAVELSIARNEALYPDPESFRPERWLEPEFPTYREPLTEHPRLMGHSQFGSGLRVCPGVELTEIELLVACGSVVGCFELGPEMGSDGMERWPDSNNRTSNVIGGPLPFPMGLTPRSKERIAAIERWYADGLADEAADKVAAR